MYKKNMFLMFICLIIMAILVGCTINKGNDKNNENINNTDINNVPKKGGVLTISTKGIKTFNPIKNKDKDINQMLKLIYSPMIDLDDDMKPVPSIIESWEFNDLKTSVVLKIRPNVKFSNGTIVTSKDIKYTIDQIRLADNDSVYKENVKNLISCKVIDDLSVKLIYDNTSSDILYTLYIPVISKEFCEKNKDDIYTMPVGSGRYIVKEYNEMKNLKLNLNENYFGNKGYIDEINVVVIEDNNTELNAFKQGQIDLVYTNKLNLEKYVDDVKIKSYAYPEFYYEFVGFNFNVPILKNEKFRKVVAYSIDKEKILNKYYLGYADIASTPIHPSIWLYDKNIKDYSYNINKASELMKSINTDKELISIRVLVNSDNYQRVNIAECLKKELAKVNINVVVDKQPLKVYLDKIEKKDFDILLAGWKMLKFPELSFAFDSKESKYGKNYGSYVDMEMDLILKRAFLTVDIDQQKQIYSELQTKFINSLPQISLFFRKNILYTNEKVEGDLKPRSWNKYNGIQNCYIK